MFNKLFEKNFARFERKKRHKLGDKKFLEKYIINIEKNSKSLRRLLPITTILLPIAVVLFTIFFSMGSYIMTAALWPAGYSIGKNTIDLIVLITLWVAIVVWGFNIFLSYTHHFKFWENKVQQWKQELQELNMKN